MAEEVNETDELIEPLSSSNEDYNNRLLDIALYGTGTAAVLGMTGYTAGKTGQTLLSSVVDTQGYGVNSPIPQYAKGGKFSQAYNNALQASGRSLRGAVKELGHSIFTGKSLELKAMESRIGEIKSEIAKDDKFNFMTKNERIAKNVELKNAENTLDKRRLLVGNAKVSVGADVSNIPMIDKDGKPLGFRTKTIVEPIMAKIDPSMKRYVGKEIDTLVHGPKQIKDFREKAQGDPRINRIKQVFGSGSRNALANVKKAIANSEYTYGKEIRNFAIGDSGLPENAKGGVVGNTKLTELKSGEGRYRLPNGARVRTFRLGFVPINLMGHTKALEYVAGQHWQYMDFAKIDGRYVPVRGGMRDIHDLGVGKATKGIERIFAKPILNTADWEYKHRKKETKPRDYPKRRKSSKILRAASPLSRVYAPDVASKVKPEQLGKLARVLHAGLNARRNPSLLLKALSNK